METTKVFMFVLFSLSYVITNNIPAKNRDFSLLFPPNLPDYQLCHLRIPRQQLSLRYPGPRHHEDPATVVIHGNPAFRAFIPHGTSHWNYLKMFQ